MKFPDLTFDVDRKALFVFKGWIKRVEKFPEWDIDTEDEQKIVQEFQNELLSSLKNLSEKKSLKKNSTDWCVGYLKGNLTSKLSILWSNKYLNRPKRYHNVLWLKAIIMYLDVDELTLTRVNRLYKYLKDGNFPFEELNEDIKNDEVFGHHILSDLEIEDNWRMHKSYLENILYDETLRMVNEQKEIEIPDLDEYFSMAELEELILKNPFEK